MRMANDSCQPAWHAARPPGPITALALTAFFTQHHDARSGRTVWCRRPEAMDKHAGCRSAVGARASGRSRRLPVGAGCWPPWPGWPSLRSRQVAQVRRTGRRSGSDSACGRRGPSRKTWPRRPPSRRQATSVRRSNQPGASVARQLLRRRAGRSSASPCRRRTWRPSGQLVPAARSGWKCVLGVEVSAVEGLLAVGPGATRHTAGGSVPAAMLMGLSISGGVAGCVALVRRMGAILLALALTVLTLPGPGTPGRTSRTTRSFHRQEHRQVTLGETAALSGWRRCWCHRGIGRF